jgi:hypothetical protein
LDLLLLAALHAGRRAGQFLLQLVALAAGLVDVRGPAALGGYRFLQRPFRAAIVPRRAFRGNGIEILELGIGKSKLVRALGDDRRKLRVQTILQVLKFPYAVW